MNIPQTDFFILKDGKLVPETTRDIFVGKRTVLFMVPGAFTPTCSERQLPEFEAAYDQICEYGVDQVICLSVNDAYVMKAWGESLGIEKVRLLPDGNGSFSVAAKAIASKENLGFGSRAWRCALIVNQNGMVEWAGVEAGRRDNATDDEYIESSPAKVVAALEAIKQMQEKAAAAEANAEQELATAA